MLVQASPSLAATTHYWKFESSPGFTADSVGSATLTPGGDPAQATLPGTGRGSAFADVVPGDASALEVTSGGRMSTGGFAQGDFTIELLAHADAIGGPSGNSIVGQANSTLNTEIAWILQIRSNQLTLLLCLSGSCEILSTGVTFVTGKDYYLAAAVDLDGGVVDLYFQNLTDGTPLQKVTKFHSKTTLNSPANFHIGSIAGQTPFGGLIDEVRLSDHVRSESELLVNRSSTVPMTGPLGQGLLVALLLVAGTVCVRQSRSATSHS
jgi:hypothetical protein